jgi:hypothetical protein
LKLTGADWQLKVWKDCRRLRCKHEGLFSKRANDRRAKSIDSLRPSMNVARYDFGLRQTNLPPREKTGVRSNRRKLRSEV